MTGGVRGGRCGGVERGDGREWVSSAVDNHGGKDEEHPSLLLLRAGPSLT